MGVFKGASPNSFCPWRCAETPLGVEVQKEPLEVVGAGARYRVRNLHNGELQAFPQREIMARARRQLGQPFPYDLVEQNCQHFATCVRYDVARSAQVGGTDLEGTSLSEQGETPRELGALPWGLKERWEGCLGRGGESRPVLYWGGGGSPRLWAGLVAPSCPHFCSMCWGF